MAHIIKSYISDELYKKNQTSADLEYSDQIENYTEEDVLLPDIQDNDELTQAQNENNELKIRINELETTISELRKDFDSELAESIKQQVDDKVKEYKLDNDNIFKDKITAFEKLLSEISDNYRNYLFDSKSTLSDIVFTSVYKLIASKYSSDEIRNIVEQSIADISDANKITVFITKKDFEAFNKASISNENLKFRVDERVKYGGCIIESDIERLDCRLDTKLEIFKNLMLGIDDDT